MFIEVLNCFIKIDDINFVVLNPQENTVTVYMGEKSHFIEAGDEKEYKNVVDTLRKRLTPL